MKLIYGLLALTLTANTSMAQEAKKDADTSKNRKTVTIDKTGIHIDTAAINVKKEEKTFEVEFGIIDIGINTIQDNTDYNSTAAKNFLQVPADMQNANLFAMRSGKSINVNIYPVVGKFRLLKTKHQKIYMSLGLGLQMYNFRYNKNISYLNETNPMVVLDTIGFTKNKLGFTYLTVPLQFTFKTKLAEKAWLVYGAGISGGYRIASWTKQISAERGKDKNHDKFNFNDFNTCITGEIGLDGYFRLYASYQLTSLHETALDQKPFCIGIRIGGI